MEDAVASRTLEIQELLHSNNGMLRFDEFKEKFAKKFRKHFSCPGVKKCGKLTACFENHFKSICSIRKEKSTLFLQLAVKEPSSSAGGHSVNSTEKAGECAKDPIMPSLDRRLDGAVKPSIADNVWNSNFVKNDVPESSGRILQNDPTPLEASKAATVKKKSNPGIASIPGLMNGNSNPAKSGKKKKGWQILDPALLSPAPQVNGPSLRQQFVPLTPSQHVGHDTRQRESHEKASTVSLHEFDSVRVSQKRASLYEFPIEESHQGGRPTKEDVNCRVNMIRGNLSKSGVAVDMFILTKKLCEFYSVRSVKELKCTDKPEGFQKEIHIAAMSEFSKLYCKVLCTIHTYCTCSTIATLYDLEKLICEKESKESFLDLKIGPLQKIPLVYDHFKFPSDMDIKRLTVTDVMKHLWKYCGKHRGEKVELEKFLEYLAKHEGYENPYEMGLKVNSIALAIRVVKTVKFGDMERMKKAEDDLSLNMREDLENYMRKIQRGLTGRNIRALPGEPENAIQQIAGMHVEDAIMKIFMHANDCVKKFERNVRAPSGFLASARKIVELMTLFRSKPVLSKFFHVILATGTFRTLGLDDTELLTVLGYKDALKQMTDEKIMDMRADAFASNQRGGLEKRLKICKEGRVKKSLHNWLGQCRKPMDLAMLSSLEEKVAQSFDVEASGFQSIRPETFLAFLCTHKEFHKYLGTSILVDSSLLNKDNDESNLRKNLEEFAFQCGRRKEKRDILVSMKKQFPRTHHNADIEEILSNDTDVIDSRLATSAVKYLYALVCGQEEAEDAPESEAALRAQKTGRLGHFNYEDAMRCLKSAPLLEDLARWSNWKLVFEPSFGDLKTFLGNQDRVHAVEISANELWKIDLDATLDDLKIALDSLNATETVGCLLSIICSNGGFSETPVIHIANLVKSSLAANIDVSFNNGNGDSLEHFVLQCLVLLPVDFCCVVANKIFLSPLCEILGDGQGGDSVPARILAVCKTTSQRSYLHRLGALLSVGEWTRDFREYCFQEPQVIDARKKQNVEITQKTVAPEPKVEEQGVKDATITDTSTENDEVSSARMPNDAEMVEDKSSTSDALSDLETNSSSVDNEESDDYAENVTVMGEIEMRLQYCQDLINDIRRNEFGKGENLDDKAASLLQKNNERLRSSLERLSKELYSKDTHFVLELVQNADDNDYDESLFGMEAQEGPSVAFIIEQTRIMVLNNECGFQDNHIRAICDVGKSTKGAHQKGYIGQKGIGFKSVFKVTNCPEIHSNGFHICFDSINDAMGYILPEWREAGDFEDLTDYTPPSVDLPLTWKTQINLPLRENITATKDTISRFQDIHPSLLLFLNRLRTIIVDDRINKKCLVMNKKECRRNIVELTQNGVPSLWFVVTKDIENHIRGEVKATDVSVAFPLDDASAASDTKTKALSTQSVYAFLPLRSYGFKFLIQADFEIPSSREDIDRDSVWNQTILKELPRVVVDAFFKFRDDETDPLYATIRVFQFLPLESEILGVFKPIARKILQLMQKEHCIPVVTEVNCEDGGETETPPSWMMPSEVILGDPNLRKIITPSELKRYLNLNYICTELQENVNSALLTTLGVHSEKLDHLLEICKSHLKAMTQQHGVTSKLVQWIGKWFLSVSDYLERHYDVSQESKQKIRNASVFPLTNGEIVNMLDFALFFPTTKKASRSKQVHKSISQVEEDLNTLSSCLFDDLDKIEELKVKRLLTDLGIKQISPEVVVKNHILPALKQGIWKEHLLYPYAVYIKEQYAVDSSTIDMEALKACVVVQTSRGPVNPAKEQVYFTEKFGNSVNLKAMFGSFKWIMIDPIYLQDSKNPNDVKAWEKFLTKLGVSHFPKMKRRTVRLDTSELADSPWFIYAKSWQPTEDGVYDIDDLWCEEFEAIMQSNDPQQLCALALELDKRWKSNFGHIERHACQVRGSNGENVCTTLCSLLANLKSQRWMPGKQTYPETTVSLFAPAELYLRRPEVVACFSDFCTYFVGELTEPLFVESIGIQHMVSVEELFRRIDTWSRIEDFSTNINHMINIYHFMKDHSHEVDATEFDKPIIFVPEERGTDPSFKVRGSFCLKKEVCLYDHSTIYTRYSSLFPSRRHLLFQFYPKDILQFFVDLVKVDSTPNVREYVNMACILADDITLPDQARVDDLMVVFATLGEKCLNGDVREELPISSDTKLDVFYAQVKDCLDETMTNFVLSNVKGECVFPTLKGRFVKVTDKPLIADAEQEREIFSESEAVYFMDVHSQIRDWFSGKPLRITRDIGDGRALRQLIRGVLAFFCVCNIDLLSSVVCPLDIIPENSEIGCYQWEKEFSTSLPYIQRYLYFKEKDLYDALVKEDIKGQLKGMNIFIVNSLTALYRIKNHDDVTVKKTKKVAFEQTSSENVAKTYFYICRDFLNEKDDIVAEFLKIFTKSNTELDNKILDLLLVLSPKDAAKKESFLKGRKIENLPKNEAAWHVPHMTKPPEVKRLPSVPTADQPERDGSLTCWPPPKPLADGTMDNQRNRNAPKPNELSQWVVPAPPESMPLEGNARVEAGVINSSESGQMKRQVSDSGMKDGRRVDQASRKDEMVANNMGNHAVLGGTKIRMKGKDGGCLEEKALGDKGKLDAEEDATGSQASAAADLQNATAVASNATTDPQNTESEPGNVTVSPQVAATASQNTNGLVLDDGPQAQANVNEHQCNIVGTQMQTGATQPPAGFTVTLPTHNLPETLHCAYENIECGRVNDGVKRMTMNINAGSVESDVIGRIGEEIVYNELLRRNATPQTTRIVWVNEKGESKLPFDIVIETRLENSKPQQDFIEVKSTNAVGDKPFEISSQELRFAFERGENYHIYRVCGITTLCDQIVIKRLAGLAKFIDRNVVKLFVVL